MAIDNGRSAEFIRRKDYPDKSRCYECGSEGHLSYQCPKNALGTREPPPKKQRLRKRKSDEPKQFGSEEETDDEADYETLSNAIAYEQSLIEKNSSESSTFLKSKETSSTQRKRIKRDSYFSDEEYSE